MPPIFTAFFTRGTFYEREAARLVRSLDRLGLAHDVRAIDPVGDWIANSRYTATHICNVLADHPDRPVVQLDADAVVWERPELFDRLDCDVAVHYRRGHELLNGTVYLAPTEGARAVARRYQTLIDENPRCTNEQTMLAKAIEQLGDEIRVSRLPASYCFIPDIMAADLGEGERIVIAHMQASRQAREVGGEAMANRQKWIVEWERIEAELSRVP